MTLISLVARFLPRLLILAPRAHDLLVSGWIVDDGRYLIYGNYYVPDVHFIVVVYHNLKTVWVTRTRIFRVLDHGGCFHLLPD